MVPDPDEMEDAPTYLAVLCVLDETCDAVACRLGLCEVTAFGSVLWHSFVEVLVLGCVLPETHSLDFSVDREGDAL